METESPLTRLRCWLNEAEAAGVPQPAAMTLATVSADGRPSTRTVSLKRLEDEGLVFTTALWTRKAREIGTNPHVSLLFHWPALGRQAHIAGRAELAPRALAEDLFGERPLLHRLQALVSRQGEIIDDIALLRRRLREMQAELAAEQVACPEDWAAVRVKPEAVELWEEAASEVLTVFGTWNAALDAAGLPRRLSSRWASADVIGALRAWAAAQGRLPRPSDWRHATPGEHPDRSTVRRLFGSWEAALQAAGSTSRPQRGAARHETRNA